ncbi:MAG: hypothetical protein AAF487_06900 [Bacteroidota bacterium]
MPFIQNFKKSNEKFKYNPRFYNEAKEKREARNRRIIRKAELEKTEEGRKKLAEETAADRQWISEKIKSENKAHKVRIRIILAVLLILVLVAFKFIGISIFEAS